MSNENLLMGIIVVLCLAVVGLFIYTRHFKSVTNNKIDTLHRTLKKSDSADQIQAFQETLDSLQKQVNSYIVEKNNEARSQEKEMARTRFLGRRAQQGGNPSGPNFQGAPQQGPQGPAPQQGGAPMFGGNRMGAPMGPAGPQQGGAPMFGGNRMGPAGPQQGRY